MINVLTFNAILCKKIFEIFSFTQMASICIITDVRGVYPFMSLFCEYEFALCLGAHKELCIFLVKL